MYCEICGMDYLAPSENKRHARYHDEHVHGVKWTPHKRENIVFSDQPLRVALVDTTSPETLQRRAYQTAVVGKRDTEYDFVSYSLYAPTLKALVGIINDRAIALLVTRPMRRASSGTWDDYYNQKLVEITSSGAPHRGCSFIWVISKFRRQGVATKLADIAMERSGEPSASFRWEAPLTSLATDFLREYSPDSIVLAK